MMRKKKTRTNLIVFICMLTIISSACSPEKDDSGVNITGITEGLIASATPFQPLPVGEEPTFEPSAPISASTVNALETQGAPETSRESPESTEPSIWINPLLPISLIQDITLPSGAFLAEKENANLSVAYGDDYTLSHWTYVLAAPFSSLVENITLDELITTWQGQPTGVFSGKQLLLDERTEAAFSWLWGRPTSQSIRTLPENEIVDTAWNDAGFALLPFEAISPRWKVIQVDGVSPIQHGYDERQYALRVPISLQGHQQAIDTLMLKIQAEDLPSFVPATNRDGSKLTVLAMTGVTALVRATAHTMELQGINYPAEDIGALLREADLTHISNEVPFAPDCPYPNPVQSDVRFCSDTRYIELLETVGTDIVELTGDHFADWGSAAMRFTLEMYEERGWQFYGGGYNINEGKKPITIEHNGNRLAFIGCNGKGGQFASASENSPGSVSCDFPYMQSQIQQLANEGYIPIATFQHFEYYTYYAQPAQQKDFRLLAEAGAVIVSGSQAHQPQAFEFHSGSLIHYGLGNLFFDQYLIGEPTRQGFIDLHVFYDGRYISTELVTIYFIDFAKPRYMTSTERASLLNAVFSASSW